jgi:hypothetical protein
MAAPNGYPSWAYNSAGQPAVIVTSLTQFNALPTPGTWSATPFPAATTPSAPYDTFNSGTGTMQVTDIRLQQQLVEARVANMILSQMLGNADDLQQVLRPDVLANDSSLTS